MTSFLFFKYFDAFELDVNVVNFVYYLKTRKKKLLRVTNKWKTWDTDGSGDECHLLEAADVVVHSGGDDGEVVLSVINHPVKRLVLLENVDAHKNYSW